MLRVSVWLIGTALWGGALAAQAAPAAGAEATITAVDVARRIGIIAHDSMLGRDTPSRGLEQTAEYVAREFAAFGLEPGGEKGTWFQRYPITRRRLDLARSRVVFRTGRDSVVARLDRTARYTQGDVPDEPVEAGAVLVGGRIAPDDVAGMALEGKVVLYVPDFSREIPVNATQVGRAIRLAGPRAIVMLANLDSAAFAARLPRFAPERTGIELPAARPPVVEVAETVLPGVLRAAGVDLAQIRSAATPVVRDLPKVRVRVELRDSVLSRLTAPNTIGILRGSDPALRDEYLVYSAHMDHIGITPGLADSINNGADDDASGTAAVIELAEAFSRAEARPRRSILFITVSGEEKGLWGSRYFTEHPTVPIDRMAAAINLDMIGRNWPDTIVAIGKEHSDLGETLERVNAAHPELGMTAIDDRWPEERFYFRSDHYNFARKGVPVLFFFNGVHEDYHRPSDEAAKIDAEKEARIVRLLYHLGREVADAPARPRWRPASRTEIVDEGI